MLKNTINWGKLLNSLKDTMEAFDDFKNKQKKKKKMDEQKFWYLKVCIFWKFIKHIMHWYKRQMLKRIPKYKIKVTKNALFFLSLFFFSSL